MRQLTAPQLRQWLDDAKQGKGDDPVLLDVREPWELQVCSLPGVRPVPMRTIPLRIDELDRDRDTVVICHHGARSYQVALFLEQQGFGRVFNLYGGMAAWSREVDPAVPTY